jgi:hypothetical protein
VSTLTGHGLCKHRPRPATQAPVEAHLTMLTHQLADNELREGAITTGFDFLNVATIVATFIQRIDGS